MLNSKSINLKNYQTKMKLTTQHTRAIELLALGETGRSTAQKLGVSEETVSRWKSDFDFMAALNSLLQDNKEAVQARLRSLSEVALETIESVMNDPDVPAKERLMASFKVLELSNINATAIGSNNPEVLEKEKQSKDFLESLSM